MTADELVGLCKDQLAGDERPCSVGFVGALPRNASGKLLKKELREKYWQGHGTVRRCCRRPCRWVRSTRRSSG